MVNIFMAGASKTGPCSPGSGIEVPQEAGRAKPAAGVLGKGGTSHFLATAGGVPRAGLGARNNEIGCFPHRMAAVNAGPAPSRMPRAQRSLVHSARGNSSRIGNVLNNLARTDRTGHLGTARNLVQLVERSGGDLSGLTGGEASLKSRLSCLSNEQLHCLRSIRDTPGGLAGLRGVMKECMSADLREKADRLLGRILARIDIEAMKRAFQARLLAVRECLSAEPVSRPAVKDALSSLVGPADGSGDRERAFRASVATLSDADLHAWMDKGGMLDKAWAEVREPEKGEPDRAARQALKTLTSAVFAEGYVRGFPYSG
ncbi:hypothetical protein ACTPOE_14545 [Castellaniella sp. WN]